MDRYTVALALLAPVLAALTGIAVPPASPGCAGGAGNSGQVVPNDNRAGAGQTEAGQLLSVRLVARAARWRPEGPQGPEVATYAFAEAGCAPQVPGPLLRVPAGTTIRAAIRNELPDTLRIFGLQTRPSNTLDSIALGPGEQRQVRFEAGAPGTYLYWGRTTRDTFALGQLSDGTLAGAIVVDSAGSRPAADERVLVVSLWRGSETPPGTPVWLRDEVLAINGQAWPYSERLSYTVGDTVRWHVVNATRRGHPLHLHGFYYQVEARGTALHDTSYSANDRRQVVTERLLGGSTMRMSWVPHTAGNWLFHCHLVEHIAGHAVPRRVPLTTPSPSAHNHALEEMSGLVLGITVRPRSGDSAAPLPAPRRQVRLYVTEQPGRFGGSSGYSFVTQEGPREPAADSLQVPGSVIELTRGEPAAITVLNRTQVPVAVHWHGIELPSYFDGVAGWSGGAARVAPAIAPGDSFLVRLTPRRAGTFIYHTHAMEVYQMGAGLFGPLLVLEPGEVRDTSRERILVLGRHGPVAGAPPSVNGQPVPAPLELRAGTTYRLRVISISPNENKDLALLANGVLQRWRPIGKDGAALPPHQAVLRPARVSLATGETWDFEYTPTVAQDLGLDVLTTGLGMPPVRNRIPVQVLPR